MRHDRSGAGNDDGPVGRIGVMIRRGSKFHLRKMPRVLVATPDDHRRAGFVTAFDTHGIEVVAVDSGQAAIALLGIDHATIDAVVVDPRLDDVTPMEIVAVSRAIDRDLAVVVWGRPPELAVAEVLALLGPNMDLPGHS